MSSEAQRVLVTENASRSVSPNAIKRTMKNFSLKAGDKLLIQRVLLQVTNPMGVRFRVEPNSMFGASQRLIKEESTRKKEEYINNEEINQVLEECQTAGIEYEIEVQAAFSQKVAVYKAAQSFQATWVVLDRQMKKDKGFLFKKLRCGISRIKSNGRIERMRGPKNIIIENPAASQPAETRNPEANEMISDNTGGENSQKNSPPPLENPKPMSGNGSADYSQYEQTNSLIMNSPLCGRAGSAHFIADHPLEEQMPSSPADSLSNGEAKSSNGVPDHHVNVQTQSFIVTPLSNGIAASTNGILDPSLDMHTPSPIANYSSNGKAGIGNSDLDYSLDVQMPSPTASPSSNGKGGFTNGFPDPSLDMQMPSPIDNYPSNGNAGRSNGVLHQLLDVPAQTYISSREEFVTTEGTTSGNAEASSSSSTNTKYSLVYLPSEAATTDIKWLTTREEWKNAWEHSPRFPDVEKLKLARSFYEGQIQK